MQPLNPAFAEMLAHARQDDLTRSLRTPRRIGPVRRFRRRASGTAH